MRQKNIWYLDLFSGIGGFREGLTQAGGFTCAGHCEIDQHADRSYRALFDTEGECFVTISEKQTPKNCRTLNFSAEDFPARLFQLLETVEDSRTQEVPCSLKLPG